MLRRCGSGAAHLTRSRHLCSTALGARCFVGLQALLQHSSVLLRLRELASSGRRRRDGGGVALGARKVGSARLEDLAGALAREANAGATRAESLHNRDPAKMLTSTAAASAATSAGARRSDASGASVDSRWGLGPTAVAVTARARRECAECFLCAAMRVARRPGAAPATAVACASSAGALTAATSGAMRPAEKRRLEERDLAIWGGPTRLVGGVLRLGRLADG